MFSIFSGDPIDPEDLLQYLLLTHNYHQNQNNNPYNPYNPQQTYYSHYNGPTNQWNISPQNQATSLLTSVYRSDHALLKANIGAELQRSLTRDKLKVDIKKARNLFKKGKKYLEINKQFSSVVKDVKFPLKSNGNVDHRRIKKDRKKMKANTPCKNIARNACKKLRLKNQRAKRKLKNKQSKTKKHRIQKKQKGKKSQEIKIKIQKQKQYMTEKSQNIFQEILLCLCIMT